VISCRFSISPTSQLQRFGCQPTSNLNTYQALPRRSHRSHFTNIHSPAPIATMYPTIFLSALLMASSAAASATLNRRDWCGVHVTQFQRNENGFGGTYEFTVTIKDQNGSLIGSVDHATSPAGVTSSLPYVLIVTAGNGDSDPVSFDYAGQHWASNSGQCSTGAYDGGSRNMDCGFTC